MTIQSASETTGALTLRHFPFATWAFVALALYGISTIVGAIVAGRQTLSGGLFALVLLSGFTLFVAASGGEITSARFDRRAGTVRLRSYSLLGLRSKEHALDEVVGLEVRVLRRAQHRIELKLRSGERLPLTSGYIVTFGTRGLARLSTFLGLEPVVVQA